MNFSTPSNSRARPAGPLARILGTLGTDISLLALFLITLAVMIASYGAKFRWNEGPITIAGSICVGLVAFGFIVRAPAILRKEPGAMARAAQLAKATLRDWGPFVLLMWAFESLETYTGVIRQAPIDDALYRFDVRLFGVEPTVWAGKLSNPLLTDWMAFAYASYFVMPMIIATALSLRRRRADFREMSTAVVMQMGIGFVLFLFFPAGPPRYYDPLLHGAFQPEHLHSFFGLYEFQQGAFDVADPLKIRSAFPSLHCSLALLSLLYAWKFGGAIFGKRPRLYFWICLPVVISLWASTIYLRHHWIPDCVAGMAIGTLANALSSTMRRHWPVLLPESRQADVAVPTTEAPFEPATAPSSTRSTAET